MSTSRPDDAAFYQNLPRKRMGAGAVIRNRNNRVLLVEPTYKDNWEIPGGIVEGDESPLAACRRELVEELSVEVPIGRLLVVDWIPAEGARTEALMFLFDGGLLGEEDEAHLRAADATELRTVEFVAVDEVAKRLAERTARRLFAALEAVAVGGTAYLENGWPIPR